SGQLHCQNLLIKDWSCRWCSGVCKPPKRPVLARNKRTKRGFERCMSLSVPPVACRQEKAAGERADSFGGFGVDRETLGRLADRMHHGRVGSTAELLADRRERLVRVSACEVHGDLAGPYQTGGTLRGEELVARDAELLAHEGLDRLDGDASRARRGRGSRGPIE